MSVYRSSFKISVKYPRDIKDYAQATKKIAEETLSFLKERYGYVVKQVEIVFLKTGNFNFYARPGRVFIEYYEGAFEKEPTYAEGIGVYFPSSPYLIVHEVCHNAFGFCAYEGLAETLSTIVCRELGDLFAELWPTEIRVKEYADMRHNRIMQADFSKPEIKGHHFGGTHAFFINLEKKIGGKKIGEFLRKIHVKYIEISQPSFVTEINSDKQVFNLLKYYGDTSMYPMVFWKLPLDWLQSRLNYVKKMLEEKNPSEALKEINTRIYPEYIVSTGSILENIVMWLQVLKCSFSINYYDYSRTEVVAKLESPIFKEVPLPPFEIFRRILYINKDKFKVLIDKHNNYCKISIVTML